MKVINKFKKNNYYFSGLYQYGLSIASVYIHFEPLHENPRNSPLSGKIYIFNYINSCFLKLVSVGSYLLKQFDIL
jgi:hypothetical protein